MWVAAPLREAEHAHDAALKIKFGVEAQEVEEYVPQVGGRKLSRARQANAQTLLDERDEKQNERVASEATLVGFIELLYAPERSQRGVYTHLAQGGA